MSELGLDSARVAAPLPLTLEPVSQPQPPLDADELALVAEAL